jgi:hypothetical protein
MKMLLIAAGVTLSASLVGCANGPVKLIPPAQLVKDFCPIVNADLAVLDASPLLTATQKALLDGPSGIIAVNKAVCAAGGTIDATDIQTLNNTAFPALIGLVSALPMLPNQPAILLGLTLAQPILNQIAAQVLPPAPSASK